MIRISIQFELHNITLSQHHNFVRSTAGYTSANDTPHWTRYTGQP